MTHMIVVVLAMLSACAGTATAFAKDEATVSISPPMSSGPARVQPGHQAPPTSSFGRHPLTTVDLLPPSGHGLVAQLYPPPQKTYSIEASVIPNTLDQQKPPPPKQQSRTKLKGSRAIGPVRNSRLPKLQSKVRQTAATGKNATSTVRSPSVGFSSASSFSRDAHGRKQSLDGLTDKPPNLTTADDAVEKKAGAKRRSLRGKPEPKSIETGTSDPGKRGVLQGGGILDGGSIGGTAGPAAAGAPLGRGSAPAAPSGPVFR